MAETRQTRRINQSRYGSTGNRSAWGYWVPLAITVTAATVGLAAWIWSERKEEEEDASSDERYSGRPPTGVPSMSGGLPPGPDSGAGGFQGPPPPGGYDNRPADGGFPGGPPPQPPWQGGSGSRSIGGQSTGVEQTRTEDTGVMARMSNALGIGRSASPNKAYDWAKGNITAGVTAAAAVVGSALGYSEENKEQYEDHNRWNEEVERRESENVSSRGLKRQGTAQEFYSGATPLPRSASYSSQKRKTVAVVVSSVQEPHNDDDDVGSHASILASLPAVVDHATTRIFVLIYAPSLATHPLNPAATNNNVSSDKAQSSPPSISGSQRISRNSSFSHIGTSEGRTPGEFPGENDGILVKMDPQPIDESTTSLYKTLHNQALALVDRDTMVIPFTSPQGHKHIIKSLQPEVVYMQESLCGTEGEVVSELSGWVRTTVVVIGDEGGLGGLVDTDTEDESARKGSGAGPHHSEKWWKKEERTGVGRGVSVVEALRIGDDWKRRVGGED